MSRWGPDREGVGPNQVGGPRHVAPTARLGKSEGVTSRRNVLFITVDQWRGDCLSALGHPVLETPSLDALAGRGVLFANHWANAAPCGP